MASRHVFYTGRFMKKIENFDHRNFCKNDIFWSDQSTRTYSLLIETEKRWFCVYPGQETQKNCPLLDLFGEKCS